MNKAFPFLAAALIGSAVIAQAQQPSAMSVGVVPVESAEEFVRWVQQKPAPQGIFPRLTQATAGKKVHFLIVVGGLHPPEQGEIKLIGDFELIAPDGKSIVDAKRCCSYTITKRPEIRTAVLGPTMNIEFGPGDPKGTYAARVSVTDGAQTLKATTQIRFGGDGSAATETKAPSVSPAPRLQMGTPPRKGAADVDKRDCLSLPTPAEVIRCTEKK